MATPLVQTFTLSVINAGNGSGKVTSSPAGINCAACASSFNSGTVVTLTPTAASGSTFAGWSNGCETGSVAMNAATSCTATFNLQQPVTRRIAAPVDVDGDGKTDLVWYNASTGTTAVWLMNGISMVSGSVLPTNPDWKVIATGDFNGDGKTDLIWYNASTGETAVWLMNGTSGLSGGILLTNPDWKVTGY